jgi:hypothetical protein
MQSTPGRMSVIPGSAEQAVLDYPQGQIAVIINAMIQ